MSGRPNASRRDAMRREPPPWARKLSDEARFLRSWLENPRTTGAITPSGPFLARAMARRVDPRSAGPVVELGPGTGPVTQALIDRGIAEDRLVLVEYDPDFCDLLRRRFPRARVVQGDAYAIAHTLRHVLSQPAAAIVSSLPLLTRPERDRAALLAEAVDLMAEGAPFIQFTYGVASPVPRQDWLTADASAPVWRNIPPARVWVYRRACGREIRPVVEPDLIDRLRSGLRDTREKVRLELLDCKARAEAELRETAERVRAHEKLQPTLAFLRKVGERVGPDGPAPRRGRPPR